MRPLGALVLAVACGLLSGCGQPDRDGMVVVLDPATSVEIVLDNTDGIDAPDGLLWSEGTLYIADEGGAAVRAWRPGSPVRTLADRGDGFSSPEDLARDRDGNLYVTDDDVGGVRRISPAGQVITLPYTTGLRSTEGLALSGEGSLSVGDQRARRLRTFRTSDGAEAVPGPGRRVRKPESLAFGGRGDLYIADNAERVLYSLDRGGRLSRVVTGRPRFSPESLHFAGGRLYITDSEQGRLYVYSESKGLVALAVFTGELANVQGITSDRSGNLYISVQADLGGGRGYILRLGRTRNAV